MDDYSQLVPGNTYVYPKPAAVSATLGVPSPKWKGALVGMENDENVLARRSTAVPRRLKSNPDAFAPVSRVPVAPAPQPFPQQYAPMQYDPKQLAAAMGLAQAHNIVPKKTITQAPLRKTRPNSNLNETRVLGMYNENADTAWIEKNNGRMVFGPHGSLTFVKPTKKSRKSQRKSRKSQRKSRKSQRK